MPLTARMERPGNKSVILIAGGWFCLALAASLAGWLEHATPQIVAATIWILTIVALIACWRVLTLRTWVAKVSLRYLILVHLTRLIGFYFFVASSRGQLPFAFAAPAGTGDIIVAVLAFLLLILSDAKNWTALIVWNTIGLTDILFVVLLALRLGLADRDSMHALREFPLSLLPTFLVPLIIVSHILIFVRATIAPKRSEE